MQNVEWIYQMLEYLRLQGTPYHSQHSHFILGNSDCSEFSFIAIGMLSLLSCTFLALQAMYTDSVTWQTFKYPSWPSHPTLHTGFWALLLQIKSLSSCTADRDLHIHSCSQISGYALDCHLSIEPTMVRGRPDTHRIVTSPKVYLCSMIPNYFFIFWRKQFFHFFGENFSFSPSKTLPQ